MCKEADNASSLLSQLSFESLPDQISLDIINEISVIIGALASDGSLTLRPLMLARAPTIFIKLINTLTQSLSKAQELKVLPSVMRALRNILVSGADIIWGHQWGVGAERKVVGTGLVGQDVSEGNDKGKTVPWKEDTWRYEATSAMASIFEVSRLRVSILCQLII